MVLCTSDLLKKIHHKYKDSAVVQEKAFDISLKCLEILESKCFIVHTLVVITVRKVIESYIYLSV